MNHKFSIYYSCDEDFMANSLSATGKHLATKNKKCTDEKSIGD
ncbi:MAG: hypothetical protein ACXWV2_13655 [Chitinophagaceae bacterium]